MNLDGLKKTFKVWRERLMQKAEMKFDVISVWKMGRLLDTIDAAIDELERMPEIMEEPEVKEREEELKPCPFCGGKAELLSHYWSEEWFYVHCIDCNCCTAIRFKKNVAVEAWNSRAKR